MATQGIGSRSCSPYSGVGSGSMEVVVPGSDELEIRQLLACRKVVGAVRNELDKGVYELPSGSSGGGKVTKTESSTIHEAVGELARTYSSVDSDLVEHHHHRTEGGQNMIIPAVSSHHTHQHQPTGGGAFGINQSVHSLDRSTSSANKSRRASNASYSLGHPLSPSNHHHQHQKPLALPPRPIKEAAEIRFVNADDAGKYQQHQPSSEGGAGDEEGGGKAAAAVEVELPGHIYKALSDTLFGGGGGEATTGGSDDGDAMYACSLEGHATTHDGPAIDAALDMHRAQQQLGFNRGGGDGVVLVGNGVAPHISILAPSVEGDNNQHNHHQHHHHGIASHSATMPFKRLPPKTYPHHWYPIDPPNSPPTHPSPNSADTSPTNTHHHVPPSHARGVSPKGEEGGAYNNLPTIPHHHNTAIDPHMRRPSLDVGDSSNTSYQDVRKGMGRKDGHAPEEDSSSLPSPNAAAAHNNNNSHHYGLVSSRLTSVSQFRSNEGVLGGGLRGTSPTNFHFDVAGEELRSDLQTAILEGFSSKRHNNNNIDTAVETEEIEVDTRTQEERVKHQKRRCRALVALVDDVLKKKYNMDPPPPASTTAAPVGALLPPSSPPMEEDHKGDAPPNALDADTTRTETEGNPDMTTSPSSPPHHHHSPQRDEAKIVPIVNLDGMLEDAEGDEMYASPPRHQTSVPLTATHHHIDEGTTQEGADHQNNNNNNNKNNNNNNNNVGGDNAADDEEAVHEGKAVIVEKDGDDYSVPRGRKMAAVLVSMEDSPSYHTATPSDAQYVPPPPPMGGYCSPRLLRSRGATSTNTTTYEPIEYQQHQYDNAAKEGHGEEEVTYHQHDTNNYNSPPYQSPPNDVHNYYDANNNNSDLQQPHHNHPHLFPSPTSTVYNGGMLGLTPMTPILEEGEDISVAAHKNHHVEEDISGLVPDTNKGLFVGGSSSCSEGDELELDVPPGYNIKNNSTNATFTNDDASRRRHRLGGVTDSSRTKDRSGGSGRGSKSKALLMEQALGRSRRDHLIEVCKAALAVGSGGAGEQNLSEEEVSLLSSTLNGSAMHNNNNSRHNDSSERSEVVRLRRLLAKAMEGKKRESSQLIDKEVSLQRGESLSLSRSRSRNPSQSQSNNNTYHHPNHHSHKDSLWRQDSPGRGGSSVTSSSAAQQPSTSKPTTSTTIPATTNAVVDDDGVMRVPPSTQPSPTPIRHQQQQYEEVGVPLHNSFDGSIVVTEFDSVVSPGRTQHGRRSMPTTVYIGMGMPPPTPPPHPHTGSPSSSRDSRSFFSVTSPPTH